MKVDFLNKAKWYILAFILVAIMLSVSLSFCAWDSLSVNAIISAKGGNYGEKPNTKYVLVTDNNSNGLADVGDIVTFGRYYQQANTTTKSDIRWIVVDKDGIKLTLLAEKVMAFGNFWGNRYYNTSGSGVWGDNSNGKYYQNYSESTLRAWLNSNYTLRNDRGTAFSAGNSEPRFRGFMNEAFTVDEQAYIMDKKISGMKGYGKDGTSTSQPYATINDKVWVPSWSEIYGTTTMAWGTTSSDGSPNARFSYFDSTTNNTDNSILNGYTTAYASLQYSNYTNVGATHIANVQNSSAGGNVWWWLRSPSPSRYDDALVVTTGGSGSYAGTNDSHGGVRPAVYVEL